MTIQIFMDILQLDYLYFISALSFPHRPIAHIFALKKQDMSDFSFIPPTSVVTISGTQYGFLLRQTAKPSRQGGKQPPKTSWKQHKED